MTRSFRPRFLNLAWLLLRGGARPRRLLGDGGAEPRLGAQAGERRRQGGDDRVMLAGHDVVAYFTRGRHAMGAPQFKSVHEGVTFRFANAEHKALFDRDPKAYLPQYGGFCANGIVYGIPWGGDADSWRIIDGKLYIFGGQGSKDAFELDVPGNLALAEKYWNEEVAGSNSFWQRGKRLVWRVPHYKSGEELARMVAARRPVRRDETQEFPAPRCLGRLRPWT
jgi:YHS domain-containing protein